MTCSTCGATVAEVDASFVRDEKGDRVLCEACDVAETAVWNAR